MNNAEKNKNNKKDLTRKITLSAILSALGVLFLMLGSVLDVLDMTSAVLAGFTVVIAVIEIGGKYPVLMYAVISLISALILPNKYPAVFFIFFGGFYPIFKSYLERFHPVIAWIVKFSMFNVFFAFMIFTVRFLSENNFLPPLEDITFLSNFTESLKFFGFVIANFVFLLYDIAMTRIITLYIVKIRKILGLKNYF